MRHRVAMTDTAALMAGTEADIQTVLTRAARDNTEATKEDWRDQIRRAGLGARLANTVRARTYPMIGESLDPATWVWTKAPTIIDAYDRGATIRPVNGSRRLAIPTLDVPKRGRRRLTPEEVETLYDQDLTIRIGRRGTLLAFVDAQGGIAQWTRANQRLRQYGAGARGARAAYKPRPKRTGKPIWKLMFILVPQVRVQKLLDTDAVAARASGRFPGLVDRHWSGMPDRTAPMKGA